VIDITAFNDGFLLGAIIAVPLTLACEHWILRPLVRLHARSSRAHRVQ